MNPFQVERQIKTARSDSPAGMESSTPDNGDTL